MTADTPLVVFPSADPTTRSGLGALLWTAPRGCVAGAAAGEAVGAALAGDDLPGPGRALAAGAGGLAEITAAAGTATGQVVAAGRTGVALATPVPADPSASGGIGALAEGRSVGAFAPARLLGGSAAPVSAFSSYLGDLAIASPVHARGHGWSIAVRVQRHYSEALGSVRLVPVGPGPVTAVVATMDYRAEILLVWASRGGIYAREIPAAGAIGSGAVGSMHRLGSADGDPEPRALLSDDGHAIVAWRSQSQPSGGAPSTRFELSISGDGLAFGAPRLLERYRDLGGFVPPAGSLRLLRLSSEAVTIAWTGVSAGRYVVRASPVSLRRGAWAPVTISGQAGASAGQAGGPAGGQAGGSAGGQAGGSAGGRAGGPAGGRAGGPAGGPSIGQAGVDHSPASDAVLADLAAGPDAEAFAFWRVAPRLASGAPNPRRWAIRAARGHYAGQGEVSFGAPEAVAPPGPNGPPAGAVDPATGRVLAAWIALAGRAGEGHIAYAVRPAGKADVAPAAVASAARNVRGNAGRGWIVPAGAALLALALAAAALLLGPSAWPRHTRARRG